MNKYSHSTDEADKIDIMFRFQYIERQIVCLMQSKMPLSHCKMEGKVGGISKKKQMQRKRRKS
jgi:hypothetical protein